MHCEDTPTLIPLAVINESSIPGPQRRGTGATLIVVWKDHRDRGTRLISKTYVDSFIHADSTKPDLVEMLGEANKKEQLRMIISQTIMLDSLNGLAITKNKVAALILRIINDCSRLELDRSI